MCILKSHSLPKLGNYYVIDSLLPSNLSYSWNFGFLLNLCLNIQIITSVILARYYSSSLQEALNLLGHTITDVNNGWLIRYLYLNLVLALLFLMCISINRTLYYILYNVCPLTYWLPRLLGKIVGCIYIIRMCFIARSYIPIVYAMLPVQSSHNLKHLNNLVLSGFESTPFQNPQGKWVIKEDNREGLNHLLERVKLLEQRLDTKKVNDMKDYLSTINFSTKTESIRNTFTSEELAIVHNIKKIQQLQDLARSGHKTSVIENFMEVMKNRESLSPNYLGNRESGASALLSKVGIFTKSDFQDIDKQYALYKYMSYLHKQFANPLDEVPGYETAIWNATDALPRIYNHWREKGPFPMNQIHTFINPFAYKAQLDSPNNVFMFIVQESKFEATLALHDDIMFYLFIMFLGVGWILLSFLKRYINI